MIAWRLSPAAKRSTTSETRIRVLRMQGRPPQMSGLVLMRESWLAILGSIAQWPLICQFGGLTVYNCDPAQRGGVHGIAQGGGVACSEGGRYAGG